ncbi:MAG: hypothetical protein M5U01_09185 [Ardenticatenaceae bacterium]|nr:hypothetical protein [Ardenticatenaceae bacterium]
MSRPPPPPDRVVGGDQAGERRLGQVLGGRARAHRDRAPAEPVVGRQDVPLDLGRDWRAFEGDPDRGAAAWLLIACPGDCLASLGFVWLLSFGGKDRFWQGD